MVDYELGAKVCRDHEEGEEDIYAICQWQSDDEISAIYVFYRILLAIYFFSTWIVIIVLREDLIFFKLYELTLTPTCFVDFFLLYASFLGYTCCMLEKIWSAVAVTATYMDLECQDMVLSTYPGYICAQIISQDYCFMVTILYFQIYYHSLSTLLSNYPILGTYHNSNSILFCTDAVILYIVWLILNFFDSIMVAHCVQLCTTWVSTLPLFIIMFGIYMDMLIFERACWLDIFKVFGMKYSRAYGTTVYMLGVLYAILGHIFFWICQAIRDCVYEACCMPDNQ